MGVAVSYPGVYIEEIPSSVHTITGVSTSVAVFNGYFSKGPINKAVQIFSMADFERTFGGLNPHSEASYGVYQFFLNGGQQAWVIRTASNASQASISLSLYQESDLSSPDFTANYFLKVNASSQGSWGNYVRMKVDYSTSKATTFNFLVEEFAMSNGHLRLVTSERYLNQTLDPLSADYIVSTINFGSKIVTIDEDNSSIPPDAPETYRPAPSGTLLDLSSANLSSITSVPISVADEFGFPQASGTVKISSSDYQGIAQQALFSSGFISSKLKSIANFPATSVKTNNGKLTITVAGTTTPVVFKTTAQNAQKDGNTLLVSPGGVLGGDIMSLDLSKLQGAYTITATAGSVSGSFSITPDDLTKLKTTILSQFATLFQSQIRTIKGMGGISVDPAGGLAQLISNDPQIQYIGLTLSAPTPIINVQHYEMGIPSNSHEVEASDFSGIDAQTIDTILGGLKAKGFIDGTGLLLKALPSGDLKTALGLPKLTLTSAQEKSIDAMFATKSVPAAFSGTRVATSAAMKVSDFNPLDGSDGGFPEATDLIGSEEDKSGIYALEDVAIFNIVCIPRTGIMDEDSAFEVISQVQAYCQKRMAFYIVDIPQTVTKFTEMKTWIGSNDTLRDKNSAIYFPDPMIPDPLNNARPRTVGASGTLAGVFANTDSTRGVWKAPAGIEAVLKGVIRLSDKLSDGQDGFLNQLGVNCLRNFPIYGNISWGARTLVGSDQEASQWKYVPVRRTALFLEQSLERGLKWVVFEPNDETLWSEIRLNVGAFMHDLFVQGAFEGTSPDQAYFVRCDSTTTTQNDIDLGIVNVVVGFAPLKPAEFVIVQIEQMAGNIQV